MFEVNVVNSLNEVMFTAKVSYIYTSAFQTEVAPHLISIKQVEAGTGNEGKNKEYQCEYRGIRIAYTKFRELMDNIDI